MHLVYKDLVHQEERYKNKQPLVYDMPVKKVGISVNESTYNAALRAVKSGEYRNLSHVFEQAARLMLKVKIEEEQKTTHDPLQASS